MSVNGMYDATTFTYYDRIFKSILFSTLFSSLLVAVIKSSIKETMYSPLLFFIFFLISFVIMLIERYTLLYIIKDTNNKPKKQVMLVGVPNMYEKFSNFIKKTHIRVNIASCISLGDKPEINSNKFKVNLEEFQVILKKEVIDEIYFAIPIGYFKEIKDYVLVCEEMKDFA